MDIGIFKKLHAAQLKCRVKLFALILSYLEVATHYLPLHQIFIFQYTLIYPIYPPPCRFNTATRRWLVTYLFKMARIRAFQHTAARRRLGNIAVWVRQGILFQHTAARRRLGPVATRRSSKSCFNTQPPEGGWPTVKIGDRLPHCFNTQPPEGGWDFATSGILRA